MTRYHLRDKADSYVYEIREGDNCPYTTPTIHRLQFDRPVPPQENLEVRCATCGRAFVFLHRQTPLNLLTTLIESSVRALPGRDLRSFMIEFQNSLSPRDHEDVSSVLPELRETIFRMVEQGQLALLEYATPAIRPVSTELLFHGDTLFQITTRTLNLSMLPK